MIDVVLRLVAGLVFGFLFGQSAEFTQQYLQRLGGAVDALAAVVARFDASAGAEGYSRETAIRRLSQNPDRLAQRQGTDAAASIARYRSLRARYDELRRTAPILRPFAVISDPDMHVARGAAEDYRPAIPTTLDGLALTFAGFVAGWGAGSGAAGLVRMRRRRKRAVLDA